MELLLIRFEQVPKIDEIDELLRQMMVALTHWHECGYCYGDIRWSNIVFVPTSGLSYWMLIGMDESQLSDATAIYRNHSYCGHQLRFQHDLCHLGNLMGDGFIRFIQGYADNTSVLTIGGRCSRADGAGGTRKIGIAQKRLHITVYKIKWQHALRNPALPEATCRTQLAGILAVSVELGVVEGVDRLLIACTRVARVTFAAGKLDIG